MKQWLQYKKTAMNRSIEFLCPHCATTAFEIVGTEKHLNDSGKADCDVIMRCLKCHEFSWHRIKTHNIAEVGSSSLSSARSRDAAHCP